ncbi:MAG TPA: RQC domain-containing protein, partial [Blastocatellia bacterium]|nr:RQC domain-containing protein [Blastocatellia bacterium]
IYSALVVLEKAGHIERGRPSDRSVLCSLKVSVDRALAAAPDDSIEAALLRDLVFTRNVSERDSTELDIDAIGAGLGLNERQTRGALGRLASRGVIDCRSVYQGRGIKLLDEKPAAALRINTRELAARAAAEQWKLRRMIDYCYHSSCLRRFILNYFGDRKQLPRCGTCSSCAPDSPGRQQSIRIDSKNSSGTLSLGAPSGYSKHPQATTLDQFIIDEAPTGAALRDELRRRSEQTRASRETIENVAARKSIRRLSPAETLVVRKILSCVARLKNRFGKGTVAAVLRGSSSKQVKENRLDELSTYGLLKTMTQDEITVYIKGLIQAGCIAVQQGAYPTVSLTQFGREVMLGRAEVELELPE